MPIKDADIYGMMLQMDRGLPRGSESDIISRYGKDSKEHKQYRKVMDDVDAEERTFDKGKSAQEKMNERVKEGKQKTMDRQLEADELDYKRRISEKITGFYDKIHSGNLGDVQKFDQWDLDSALRAIDDLGKGKSPSDEAYKNWQKSKQILDDEHFRRFKNRFGRD